MGKKLITAVLMTVVTTVLLGLIYPLVVTGLSQLFFRDKANGQLIFRAGQAVGSRIIAQPFTEPRYFHPRPSAAAYDAANSAGTQLGPTNARLVERVRRDTMAAQAENPGKPVPIDLVTTSASGLDPHITPASAYFQLPRIARERGASEATLKSLIEKHTEGRQFEILGEARVNVLELNLELDQRFPAASRNSN